MAGPTQDPYFMEISPYGLRGQTAVIKSFGDAAANLFSAFVNPIGIASIGWRYYIVWCVVLVSNFVVIYLFFPEVSRSSCIRCAIGSRLTKTSIRPKDYLSKKSLKCSKAVSSLRVLVRNLTLSIARVTRVRPLLRIRNGSEQ